MKKIILFIILLSAQFSYGLTIEELNELKAVTLLEVDQTLFYEYSNYLYQKETNFQHQQYILYIITLGNSRYRQGTLDGLSWVEGHLYTELMIQELLQHSDPIIIEDLDEGDQPEDRTQ